jgi:hypothetical protein
MRYSALSGGLITRFTAITQTSFTILYFGSFRKTTCIKPGRSPVYSGFAIIPLIHLHQLENTFHERIYHQNMAESSCLG